MTQTSPDRSAAIIFAAAEAGKKCSLCAKTGKDTKATVFVYGMYLCARCDVQPSFVKRIYLHGWLPWFVVVMGLYSIASADVNKSGWIVNPDGTHEASTIRGTWDAEYSQTQAGRCLKHIRIFEANVAVALVVVVGLLAAACNTKGSERTGWKIGLVVAIPLAFLWCNSAEKACHTRIDDEGMRPLWNYFTAREP